MTVYIKHPDGKWEPIGDVASLNITHSRDTARESSGDIVIGDLEISGTFTVEWRKPSLWRRLISRRTRHEYRTAAKGQDLLIAYIFGTEGK